jgi:hypothetical protein
LNFGKTRQGENKMGTTFTRKLLLGAAIAGSMGVGYAIGAQPHMTESVSLLQSARAELAKATPNKGGHRERALGLIDQAIGEVKAGIAFAAGGCGEGWHRGPYGGCLRNYANPAAHACPRGYHIGPNGGCRGNGR